MRYYPFVARCIVVNAMSASLDTKSIRELADGDVWASFSKNIDDENDKDRREDREVDISGTNVTLYTHPKATRNCDSDLGSHDNVSPNPHHLQ
jgi:hypothetical protein